MNTLNTLRRLNDSSVAPFMHRVADDSVEISVIMYINNKNVSILNEKVLQTLNVALACKSAFMLRFNTVNEIRQTLCVCVCLC